VEHFIDKLLIICIKIYLHKLVSNFIFIVEVFILFIYFI